jgi:hypothetical protein
LQLQSLHGSSSSSSSRNQSNKKSDYSPHPFRGGACARGTIPVLQLLLPPPGPTRKPLDLPQTAPNSPILLPRLAPPTDPLHSPSSTLAVIARSYCGSFPDLASCCSGAGQWKARVVSLDEDGKVRARCAFPHRAAGAGAVAALAKISILHAPYLLHTDSTGTCHGRAGGQCSTVIIM